MECTLYISSLLPKYDKLGSTNTLLFTSIIKFDFFHWNYLLGFVLVTIIIVVGLTEDPPSVRMTSLPPSILLVQVGLTLVIVGVLAKLRVRQPFPVSSMPAGTAFRPGILVIIEDVVAVDGGRGRAYRSALMERYAASLRFRRLIEDLNWFWGFGGLLMGIVLICILASVGSQTFAFGLGKFLICLFNFISIPVVMYPTLWPIS